jgi:anaerobic selenocysteine-containing dehydrogenase
MSPHGSLTEYLRMSLMTLCGHWRRAEDPVAGYGILVNPLPALAQATDPTAAMGLGERMRVRNLAKNASGMPTSALAEEILLEGEGRVRVLITVGGNPLAAWPDQLRTLEALKKLDLLVCLDPVITETGNYAHYIVAPKVQYETTTTTMFEMVSALFPLYRVIEPYAAVAPPLVQPPAGADVIDDWQFFYELARHMGLSLTLKPVSFIYDPAEAQKRAIKLDMQRRPTPEEMWGMLLTDSPVPLAEVMAHPGGKIFDIPEQKVMPKTQGWAGKLDIGNAEMLQDLQRAYADVQDLNDKEFPYRLIGRRLKDRFNSAWRDHGVSTRQWPYNPAFINPEDMLGLGLASGDIIEIRSGRAAIKGVVEADRTLLSGVIAMSHAWGGSPEHDLDPVELGANTGLLTDNTKDYDYFSAMPRMSTIAVTVRLIEKRSATLTDSAHAEPAV